MPTYDRPVNAKLLVRLDNGEEWEPTEEDLDKFGYVNKSDAYHAFEQALLEAAQRVGINRVIDATELELNPIRYLAEQVIVYRFVHPVAEDTLRDVGAIERDLVDFRGGQAIGTGSGS